MIQNQSQIMSDQKISKQTENLLVQTQQFYRFKDYLIRFNVCSSSQGSDGPQGQSGPKGIRVSKSFGLFWGFFCCFFTRHSSRYRLSHTSGKKLSLTRLTLIYRSFSSLLISWFSKEVLFQFGWYSCWFIRRNCPHVSQRWRISGCSTLLWPADVPISPHLEQSQWGKNYKLNLPCLTYFYCSPPHRGHLACQDFQERQDFQWVSPSSKVPLK